MYSAFGNTRRARKLYRVAVGLDWALLLLLCPLVVTGKLVVLAALLLAFLVNGVAVAYALDTGLFFEMRVDRRFQKVCQGLGFIGEANDYAATVRQALGQSFNLDIYSHKRIPTQKKAAYPSVRDVRGTWESFTGTVRPLYGQTVEEYNAAAPAFALAFNVKYVGFERSQNGLLRVRVGEVPVPGAYNYGQVAPSPSQAAQLPQTANAGKGVPAQHVIQQVVPSVYTAPQPDYRVANVWAEELALLRAVPMARCIEGNVWKMPVEGQHILIAAATGCGKGSWIWSLVFGLLPAWQAGLVEFWGVDPKVNELAMGPDFWTRYADTDEDSVVLLEEAVNVMHERGKAMQGIRRKFVPSLATPLIVLVIDEIAYLSALLPDKKLRERANTAITSLLNKGRSPGIACVGATQDVRKEVINNRDGYTIRIAGRMTAPMVDLVLGEGAYEAGCLCDQIPPPYAGGAGVAYVLDVMSMEPRLVRAAWCSDDDIRSMMAGLPKPGTPSGPVWEQLRVKDEQLSGQLDWNGQPHQQWQYKVE